MSRPVIGITCYVEPARFTVWETTTALLPYDYVDHVARAGGQPVILPPAGDPSALAGRLDGLILAGGGDVDRSDTGRSRTSGPATSGRSATTPSWGWSGRRWSGACPSWGSAGACRS